jgi:hypothetical protein
MSKNGVVWCVGCLISETTLSGLESVSGHKKYPNGEIRSTRKEKKKKEEEDGNPSRGGDGFFVSTLAGAGTR